MAKILYDSNVSDPGTDFLIVTTGITSDALIEELLLAAYVNAFIISAILESSILSFFAKIAIYFDESSNLLIPVLSRLQYFSRSSFLTILTLTSASYNSLSSALSFSNSSGILSLMSLVVFDFDGSHLSRTTPQYVCFISLSKFAPD
jgi:hypothetical protein